MKLFSDSFAKRDLVDCDKQVFEHAKKLFDTQSFKATVEFEATRRPVFLANIQVYVSMYGQSFADTILTIPNVFSTEASLPATPSPLVMDMSLGIGQDFKKQFIKQHPHLVNYDYSAPLLSHFFKTVKQLTPQLTKPARKSEWQPKVSCIVLTGLNNRNTLARMLKSFIEHTDFPEPFEIIVVVNGSSDNSDILATKKLSTWNKAPYKIVKIPFNVGIAGGFNAGMKIAEGQYICLLQDDIAFTENDWLHVLVRNMDAYPQIGILAGFRGGYRYENDDNNPLMPPVQNFSSRLIGMANSSLMKEKLVEVHVASCMCAIHRVEVGSYVEDFLPNGLEDSSFSFEVRRQGFQVYATDIGIIHGLLPGATGRTKTNMTRRINSLIARLGFRLKRKTPEPHRRITRAYHYTRFRELYADMLSSAPELSSFEDIAANSNTLTKI